MFEGACVLLTACESPLDVPEAHVPAAMEIALPHKPLLERLNLAPQAGMAGSVQILPNSCRTWVDSGLKVRAISIVIGRASADSGHKLPELCRIPFNIG